MSETEQDIVFCKNCHRAEAVEDFRCTNCGELICILCGCTESAACPGGCYWIRIGVCSECD